MTDLPLSTDQIAAMLNICNGSLVAARNIARRPHSPSRSTRRLLRDNYAGTIPGAGVSLLPSQRLASSSGTGI